MLYEHEFSKESEEALNEFIETCKKLKEYHEPKDEYIKIWKPVIKNLAQYEVAHSSQSVMENKYISNEPEDIKKCERPIEPSQLCIIKNDFSDEEDMLNFYIDTLQNAPEERIQETYKNSLPHINLPDLIKIGQSIIDKGANNIIVKYYCRELLFQLMSQIFRDDLKFLFQEFCGHYKNLVIKEMVHFLKAHDKLEFFFLYLNSKSSLEDLLLREFLGEFEEQSLLKKHILVLDNLIHKENEYDSIKIVINLLSTHAVEYKKDQDYGKLLLKVIEILGPKLHYSKSQIDVILDIHSSKWNIKLKKIYNKYLEK